MLELMDQSFHRLGFMGVEVVPNQANISTDMTQQMTDKHLDLVGPDGFRADQQEQPGISGDAGNGRAFRP